MLSSRWKQIYKTLKMRTPGRHVSAWGRGAAMWLERKCCSPGSDSGFPLNFVIEDISTCARFSCVFFFMNAPVVNNKRFLDCHLDPYLYQNTQQWAIRWVGGCLNPLNIGALCKDECAKGSLKSCVSSKSCKCNVRLKVFCKKQRQKTAYIES